MDTDPQPAPDPDEQPDPTDTQAQPAPVEDNPGEPSAAAPAEDEAAGAAPTDLPSADGEHAHADELVGDWARPDVDLSGLIPESDGDPDDDEGPVETVEQDATSRATVEGGPSGWTAPQAPPSNITEPTA